MGRDITLFPHKATKSELKKLLESNGFKPCKHLWDWPKGTLNFYWFEHEDYKSIDGVSADIYPIGDDERDFTENEWALHVRTRYSASLDDVKIMNHILREGRKLFGGTIDGDYGKNRYAPLWDDNSTPLSRGISMVYQRIDQEIRTVLFSLPDPMLEQPPVPQSQAGNDLADFMKSMDPSRVIYNGLVPFAVAMFEHFFSEIFQVLIAYDEVALENRKNHKQRIDFETLLEVGDNQRTIENIIASNYTFQNLNQLNKAYKDWLSIDVRNILYKKKKIGNSINFLENKISEIIEYRHGIVHRFEIDRTLTKEGYTQILETIQLSMTEFIDFLNKKYKIDVTLD